MRFVLPATAIAIMVAILSWSGMEEAVQPIAEDKAPAQTIGKNELIKPRFESQDKKQQAYTITADRAFQNQDDLNTVILENPVADVTLNDGAWIALQSIDGQYNQQTEKLYLSKNVKLYHDQGYSLDMQTLMIDMNAQTADTQSAVTGQGPAGTIQARGMKGIGAEGRLIFLGPATLILNQTMDLP